jgi:hypothetical protein
MRKEAPMNPPSPSDDRMGERKTDFESSSFSASIRFMADKHAFRREFRALDELA